MLYPGQRQPGLSLLLRHPGQVQPGLALHLEVGMGAAHPQHVQESGRGGVGLVPHHLDAPQQNLELGCQRRVGLIQQAQALVYISPGLRNILGSGLVLFLSREVAIGDVMQHQQLAANVARLAGGIGLAGFHEVGAGLAVVAQLHSYVAQAQIRVPNLLVVVRAQGNAQAGFEGALRGRKIGAVVVRGT